MKNKNAAAQPFVLTLTSQKGNISTRRLEERVELRSGDQCPAFQKNYLDYDGRLNLSCPSCGYAVGGCFT